MFPNAANTSKCMDEAFQERRLGPFYPVDMFTLCSFKEVNAAAP
jgi:hypothetical protein